MNRHFGPRMLENAEGHVWFHLRGKRRSAPLSDGLGTLLAPLIVDELPPHCCRLLEVGCGSGVLAAELNTFVEKVVAIDISRQGIAKAISTFGNRPGLDFRIGDAEHLDDVVGAATFDCIVSVLTLHHVDVERVLRLMKRRLTANGRIIIIDLYAEQKTSLMQFLVDQFCLSHLYELPSIVRTVRRLGLLNAFYFLLWRGAYAASNEGRRHIRADLSLGMPFSLSQWRYVLRRVLPRGMEQVLMGSVFMYSWDLQ